MFLLVKKNTSGEWEIIKVITNIINVRSTIRDVTYGDISKLDLETQKLEGFWQQEDKYEGTGEYQIFSHKEVVFDEEAAVVRNTYHYVQMPLDDIKSDFKQRVKSERDNRYNNQGVVAKNKIFPSDSVSRTNYSLMASAALIDPSSFPVSSAFTAIDGEDVTLSLSEFNAMVVQLAKDTHELYAKCRDITSLIDLAESLEEVIAASDWQ